MITLDSLADEIMVYSIDCILEKRISPHLQKDKKDVIILNFAWSNKQQRIGATLKDFSLSFWDATDNYEAEKNFFISNYSTEYQNNIWYIEFLDTWVTTDKTNAIWDWNIETESLNYQLVSPMIKSTIFDIVEIAFMKLVALGTMEKLLMIWDLPKKLMILKINMSQGGIHSLKYFNTYQVLVTAGYENSISIFEIHPQYLDQSLLGKLIGHNSMVTAIQCIEKTPMIISADDTGIIKLWDIRTFKCIQTCDVGSKSVISKILDIEGHGKICFISSRINFLEFDESFQTEEKKQNSEEMYPLKVEFNYLADELIVCSRKDLRFIDLERGRIKKIYQGLLRNNDDDITIFKSVEQNKKFVIGDHRGGLNMFNFQTGEKCQTLCGHTNEVSVLKVDFINKLFISAGHDSAVYVQKENNKEKFEIKREIKNCFHNKEIQLMEVSVYHNLLVMGSNTKDIYIWDYEYCKLLGFLELEEGYEPTSLVFINGYSILLIGASNNKIYIVQIIRKDQNTDFQLFGVINLEDTKEKGTQNFQANKLLIDINFNLGMEYPSECLLYLSLLKGNVKVYNLLSLFETYNPPIIINSNKRMNYNAYRGVQEDFDTALKKIKTNRFCLNEENAISAFTPKLSLSFLAHKDSITTLILINLAEKSLLTSSLDHYIKIWSLKGEKLAAFNINHPLPILWNVTLDKVKRTRKNILFALKIVELIFRRYKRSILLSEEKMININNFLAFLATDLIKPKDKKKNTITLPSLNTQPVKNILLLGDEYSPRDLQFENIKNIYQKELMGPSLREMENNKRLMVAQRFWKNKLDIEEQGASLYEQNKLEDKLHKEKDPLAFFDTDFRDKLSPKIPEDDFSDQVQRLSKRMENHIKRKRINVPTSTHEKSMDSQDKKLNKFSNDKNSKKKGKTNLDAFSINKETLSSQKIMNNEGTFNKPGIEEFDNKNNRLLSLPKHSSRNERKPQAKKLNLFDYANQKQLILDNSSKSSLDTFSLTTYTKSKNIEEKMQFHKIMRNIDKKLRTSQFNFTRNALLTTDDSFSKTFTKTMKMKKPLKKLNNDNYYNNINNTRGSLKTNDTNIDEEEIKIDTMIAEIRQKVKDNVSKKLMVELDKRKRENELHLKYELNKIMLQTSVDVTKENEERGFVGLGSVFQRMDWNK